jgi:hypothetical protein
MENAKSVDQRRQAVDLFIAAHRDSLIRQGAVVSKWRQRGGRTLGPYYLLVCRDRDGRQRSVYLAPTLVEEVREMLRSLQLPIKQSRSLEKARRKIRSALRKSWTTVSMEISQVGLKRKGAHINGWSTFRLTPESSSEPVT